MFQDWVRTTLIWVGMMLLIVMNFLPPAYGEPYLATIGGIDYICQDPITPVYYWFLYLLAIASVMTGCYIWTRLKNRHWAFMFWGIAAPIGLLGISLIEDRTELVSNLSRV